jgi:hypothetical protein
MWDAVDVCVVSFIQSFTLAPPLLHGGDGGNEWRGRAGGVGGGGENMHGGVPRGNAPPGVSSSEGGAYNLFFLFFLFFLFLLFLLFLLVLLVLLFLFPLLFPHFFTDV